jgi:hypothetical protein
MPTSRSWAAATPALDGDPGEGARPRAQRRDRGGEHHRLGGIRTQRRVRRGQPHAREANGERRWPEELRQLDRIGHANLDAIEDTVAKYTMDVDFERTGTLSVALEPHELEWIEGPSTPHDVYLNQEDVRAEVDSPTYLAGRWDKRSTALVHPGRLAAELARVARGAGRRHLRTLARAPDR